MHRSHIDDSVTYYETDMPINFVRRLSFADREQTAQMEARKFAIQPISQHGRTAHKKKRVNSFATEQDSLLEMTVASEVSNGPSP